MDKHMKIEDFQEDIDKKNYDKVYKQIVEQTMKLLKQIAKKFKIEIDFKETHGDEYPFFEIEYNFARQSYSFGNVKYMMYSLENWEEDPDDLLKETPEAKIKTYINNYNRLINTLEEYENVEEEIKVKGYENLKNAEIKKLIKLFKEMMEYKHKKYDENWDFETWLDKLDEAYHYYHNDFMDAYEIVERGCISREVDADYEVIIKTTKAERIIELRTLYDFLTWDKDDYKNYANYYRDYELKEGQTYKDLFDLEKEKFVKLFKEMLELVKYKYESNDFYALMVDIKNAYPFYRNLITHLDVELSQPYTTYIENLDYMEDVYENLSKNYKNFDENMKKFQEQQKDLEQEIDEGFGDEEDDEYI